MGLSYYQAAAIAIHVIVSTHVQAITFWPVHTYTYPYTNVLTYENNTMDCKYFHIAKQMADQCHCKSRSYQKVGGRLIKTHCR